MRNPKRNITKRIKNRIRHCSKKRITQRTRSSIYLQNGKHTIQHKTTPNREFNPELLFLVRDICGETMFVDALEHFLDVCVLVFVEFADFASNAALAEGGEFGRGYEPCGERVRVRGCGGDGGEFEVGVYGLS